MAGPGLPVNIDSSYLDDAGDASVKLHQQHHDLIHAIVNAIDDDTLPSTPVPLAGVLANNQTGTSYTLVLSDAGKVVELDDTDPVSVLVPTNAAVAFPVGTIVELWQQGTGQVTVGASVPGTTTIRSPDAHTSIATQYGSATLRKRASEEWSLGGNLDVAGTFAANTVADLQCWWKADSLALADAATVTTWTDSSPNAYVATATGTPTYRATGGPNSKPTVQFVAASSQYFRTNAPETASVTIFVVARTNTVDMGEHYAIVGNDQWGGGVEYRFDGTGFSLQKSNVEAIGSSNAGLLANTWYIETLDFLTASAYHFFRNGTADGSGTYSSTLSLTYPRMLGASWGGAFADILDGYIAEVLIYSRVLTAGERATVHTYLSDKYAISVSDHV